MSVYVNDTDGRQCIHSYMIIGMVAGSRKTVLAMDIRELMRGVWLRRSDNEQENYCSYNV